MLRRGRGTAADIAALAKVISMNDVQQRSVTPLHLLQFNPEDRRSFIGGSDARIIMGADEATLVRLWREKRGEVEPEDLADNLTVQLGSVTEDLNRRWYERHSGHVIKHVQRRMQHPVNKWMAATLDGLIEPSGVVFEAKFMLPWSFRKRLLPKSTWRSYNITCGSSMRGQPSFRSLPAAANGWK
jgi:hypothetical protein